MDTDIGTMTRDSKHQEEANTFANIQDVYQVNNLSKYKRVVSRKTHKAVRKYINQSDRFIPTKTPSKIQSNRMTQIQVLTPNLTYNVAQQRPMSSQGIQSSHLGKTRQKNDIAATRNVDKSYSKSFEQSTVQEGLKSTQVSNFKALGVQDSQEKLSKINDINSASDYNNDLMVNTRKKAYSVSTYNMLPAVRPPNKFSEFKITRTNSIKGRAKSSKQTISKRLDDYLNNSTSL
jgi:hypothetical protein